MNIKANNSKFNRNVLTLLTGATIAQAIPVAISPILTRIYTPEDFGIYTLFFAISAIFGSIVTGKYEFAIMLPDKEEDAINLFALGLLITLITSFILLLVIILFHTPLVNALGNEEIATWLYIIPASVFFIGLFNLLSYFNNRRENYKEIANATIIKSIFMASIQLGIGFIKTGAAGLISGKVIADCSANMRLAKCIFDDKLLISTVNLPSILRLAKHYHQFPTFSLGSTLAGSLSKHLLDILISAFYSIATLGYYSLIQRVLGMPANLIGAAVGRVFFREATREKNQTQKAVTTFDSTVKKLLIIGMPSFTIIFFIAEDLFAFVFGEDWRIAGYYASIVTPLFFIRFIYASVSSIYDIFGKLKTEFTWQICLLLGVIIVITSANAMQMPFNQFLYILTTFSFLMYCVSFYIIFRLSRDHNG